MSTAHEQALHDLVDDVLREETAQEAILAATVRRLQTKFYAPPWPDIIKQTPFKPAYDLYDAYVFVYIWQRIWEAPAAGPAAGPGDGAVRGLWVSEQDKEIHLRSIFVMEGRYISCKINMIGIHHFGE
jgi:hypothetical protein